MSAFTAYWRTYGGFGELVASLYLWISLAVTLVCRNLWLPAENGNFVWHDYAFAVLPGMISFSLGALAIVLAFSNEKFIRIVVEGGKNDFFFIKAVAAFFHFIVVQFLALICLFIFLSWPSVMLSFGAFSVFMYAIFTGIAAAAALFGMAEILNASGGLD